MHSVFEHKWRQSRTEWQKIICIASPVHRAHIYTYIAVSGIFYSVFCSDTNEWRNERDRKKISFCMLTYTCASWFFGNSVLRSASNAWNNERQRENRTKRNEKNAYSVYFAVFSIVFSFACMEKWKREGDKLSIMIVWLLFTHTNKCIVFIHSNFAYWFGVS